MLHHSVVALVRGRHAHRDRLALLLWWLVGVAINAVFVVAFVALVAMLAQIL
jgi:hypothetical protein